MNQRGERDIPNAALLCDIADAIKGALRKHGHFYDYCAGVSHGRGTVSAGDAFVRFSLEIKDKE